MTISARGLTPKHSKARLIKIRVLIQFIAVFLIWTAATGQTSEFRHRQDMLLLSQQARSTAEQLDEMIERQKKMERDIQEIKAILQRATGQAPSPPKEFSLNLENAPFKGNREARIVLIEFSDYQCPFCSRHFRETLPEIEKEYLVTGKLKYIFWDFPLQSIHRDAFKAHEAAYCAGEQGKYWEMHDRLFVNQDALAVPELAKHAIAIDVDVARFQSCLNSEKHAARIRSAVADAQKIGVTATPTFFVVDRSSAGQLPKILRIIRGVQSYAQFRDALEKALAE